MFLPLKNLPIIEIPVQSSENIRIEKPYPNMSINFSLRSSMETLDYLLINNSFNKIQNNSLQSININRYENDNDSDDNEQFFLYFLFDYLFNFDWLQHLLLEEQYILEYSLEYGFLRLLPETRKRLNIEVLLVTLGMKEKDIFVSKFDVDCQNLFEH